MTTLHNVSVDQCENRLHDLIQRFNQTLAENMKLKGSIELLRKEKETYDHIHSRMSIELSTKSSEIESIVEKSKSAYAARDAANSQKEQLKIQADREHAEFEKEWQELARLFENDRKVREFVLQKETLKKTKMGNMDDPLSSSALQSGTIRPSTGSLTTSEENRLTELEKLFDSVRTATGLRSLDDLVSFFIEEEKENYSLFNKLNQNINEIEKISFQIKAVEENIESLRNSVHHSVLSSDYSPGGSSASTRSGNREIDALEMEVVVSEQTSDQIGSKNVFLAKLISSIRTLIQSIFSRIFPNPTDCLTYIAPAVVASSAGVSGIPIGSVIETNMAEYLAAIEKRVDEIIEVYRVIFPERYQRKSVLPKGAKGSHGRSMNGTMSLGSLAVVPGVIPGSGILPSIAQQKILQYKLPSAVDDESVEENGFRDEVEVGRPLTRDELRVRSMLAMQKNQEKKLRRMASKPK